MDARFTKGRKVILLLGRPRGGGSEAHATWLCGALRRAGVAAELYSLFPQTRGEGLVRELREGLTLWPSFRGFLRFCAREQPASVICFGRVANALGYRIQWRFPEIRLIATCRSNRRLPAGYQRSLVRADTVLVNADWAAARVRALPGLRAERVRVLPNALMRPELAALEHSAVARDLARKRLGLGDASFVLTALAHFVPGKNQEALIRLLARGLFPPGTRLLLVGEGPRRAACQRLGRRLGVLPELRFPGRIEALEAVFQASDLVVSTSLRDSLPNALVEAQAAGLPVVAYDIAGVGEAFLPGESGMLRPPDDPEALAAAVCQLLEDPAKRSRFAIAAREQALRRFDADAVLRQYLDMLCVQPQLSRTTFSQVRLKA